jgi:cAMP-dependent protein kinase regulator
LANNERPQHCFISLVFTLQAKNPLFMNLDSEQRSKLFEGMKIEEFGTGSTIIQQGDTGADAEDFYIIKSGRCDVLKEVPFSSPVKVATLAAGHSFGELALMYSAPRAATITAKINTVTWTISGSTFRRVIKEAVTNKRSSYESFIEAIPLFESLDDHDRGLVADAFEEAILDDNETAVTRGEQGTHLFVVQEGQLQTETDDGEEHFYDAGGWFGEIALLSSNPQEKTVRSVGFSKVLKLDRRTFKRLTGSQKTASSDAMKGALIGESVLPSSIVPAVLETEHFLGWPAVQRLRHQAQGKGLTQ